MKCFECGADADQRHHVVPKCRGGTATVPLCGQCHGKCHSKKMTTAAMTREALHALRQRGRRVGQIPLGMTLQLDNKTLMPVAEELAIIDRIRAERAAGRSMRAIAADLTTDGIPTKRGNAVWSYSTIQRIVSTLQVKEDTDGTQAR
jgi:hypothetical protein